MSRTVKTIAFAAAVATATAAPALSRGIGEDEIRLGMITDLSGPVIEYGNEARNAATMAVEEINAAGGVHGRKINLIVEDNGYEPRKAMLAAQKLVNQDDVMAVLGHLGTATNMAVLPMLIENKVYNFLPQGGSPAFYDPPDRYKIGLAPSYTQTAFDALTWMYGQNSYERACALYQDDDYGRESLEGLEIFARKNGIEVTEKVSYKRGATDFSSQIARLRAADCDLVHNSTTVRELVASISEANKIGFKPTWLGNIANYSIQAAQLGGDNLEGVYNYYVFPIPYLDSENEGLARWAQTYVDRFGSEPGIFSMYSYYAVRVFAQVAEAAGRDLNDDSFAAALESTKIPPNEMGVPGFGVTADNRLATSAARMVQMQNGKWVEVSDWLPVGELD